MAKATDSHLQSKLCFSHARKVEAQLFAQWLRRNTEAGVAVKTVWHSVLVQTSMPTDMLTEYWESYRKPRNLAP